MERTVKRLHLLGYQSTQLPEDFWQTSHCEILILDHWAKARQAEVAILKERLPEIKSHVWLSTSGTLAQPGNSKWIAISKEAILASANAVNQHLSIQNKQSWGLSLPLAHVGGLGIIARAHLLGQKVISLQNERWRPEQVASEAWSGHWLSLVPTQLHDVVKNKLTPPPSLLGVILGGDRLDENLRLSALELGWPVLPSYGLTEFASQVATATHPTDARFKILSHAQLKVDSDERLWISGAALFTGMAQLENGNFLYEERQDIWWGTQDRAEISGDYLAVKGRLDSIIKIRGEKVDITALEQSLLDLLSTPLVVIPISNDRDGFELWCVSENNINIEQMNQGLLPHQKIKGIKVLDSFPRTELGKIRRGEVREWLFAELKR
jgi:O-succinylbenzoic acid--CoA ligase